MQSIFPDLDPVSATGNSFDREAKSKLPAYGPLQNRSAAATCPGSKTIDNQKPALQNALGQR
jgi:hypothetical protein